MSGQKPARDTLRDRIREQRQLLGVIAIAELIAIIAVSAIDQHNHIDGEVYQLGAKALLSGRDLYENLPTTESGLRLPFIYPPFAAVVFAPLAVAPKSVAIAAITLVTHVTLLTTLYVILSSAAFLVAHREKVLLVTAAVLPLATISEPVQETVGYAQINVVLMALVAVDCLWRVDGERKLPYPRGLLIGLAAGIKLTPAVFLLFFLLRKDFRSIAVSLISFLGTVALGMVVAFDAAKKFWTQKMLASSSVNFGPMFTGDASTYAGNQSLRSLLTKLEVPGMWLTLVYLVLSLIMLVLAVVGMKHAFRQQDPALAVTVNGVLGLLLSPISWSHHWVWAIPALVLLLGAAFTRRDWALLMATSLAAGFFAMAPHWKMRQGGGLELQWNFFEHLLGNSYIYFGMAFVMFTAYLGWRARKRPQASPGSIASHSPETSIITPVS